MHEARRGAEERADAKTEKLLDDVGWELPQEDARLCCANIQGEKKNASAAMM